MPIFLWLSPLRLHIPLRVALCALGLMVPHSCFANAARANKQGMDLPITSPSASAPDTTFSSSATPDDQHRDGKLSPDAVKSTDVATNASAQPDVVIERLDEDGDSVETLGGDILNDDARQTSKSFVLLGSTKNYLIHVKNTGQSAATFQVNLNGLLSPSGAATAWNTIGWTAHATLRGTHENILTALQSEVGWETPVLLSGAEAVIALSFSAPADTTPAPADNWFRATAKSGGQSDAVVGNLVAQFMAKLQWNAHGDPNKEADWQDLTPSTVINVEQCTMIPLRAVKAVPTGDWPDVMNGPVWLWQGIEVDGEIVWLRADTVTGDAGMVASVTCGNTLSVKVHVFEGDAFIKYDKPDAPPNP